MYRERRSNKFGAASTEYNGIRYNSKFEAAQAEELDLRLKAGEIAVKRLAQEVLPL